VYNSITAAGIFMTIIAATCSSRRCHYYNKHSEWLPGTSAAFSLFCLRYLISAWYSRITVCYKNQQQTVLTKYTKFYTQ